MRIIVAATSAAIVLASLTAADAQSRRGRGPGVIGPAPADRYPGRGAERYGQPGGPGGTIGWNTPNQYGNFSSPSGSGGGAAGP